MRQAYFHKSPALPKEAVNFILQNPILLALPSDKLSWEEDV